MKYQLDDGGNVVRFFTPYTTVSSDSGADWTPDASMMAFSVNADCTMAIDGGTAFAISKGDVFGVYPGSTYVFVGAVVLAIM